MIKYKTRDDALKAVKQDGKLLEFVESRFRDDEEIVSMALKHGGDLTYASARLHNDPTLILEEARHRRGFEFNFDKALFCAKRDLKIAQKFTKLYSSSDEFQILLKLHYSDKYLAPIKKYNFMTPKGLQKALSSYRKQQIKIARDIYVKGYDHEYVDEYMEPDRSATGLLWQAVWLREEGLPFSNIIEYFPECIAYEKEVIDKYCSGRLSGSYPERLLSSLLSILGVDFSREQTFSWATNILEGEGKRSFKRYDFYIPSLNTIIEVHGSQHYGGGFEYLGGRSLEEERENDKQKEQLAKANGIKHYIVINALSSTLSFIKESVVSNAEFTSLFDISEIDWDEVEAGTVAKEKTDISFPLYEEKALRCAEWVNIIKTTLIPADYTALKSTKREIENTDSQELLDNIRNAFPSAGGLYPHELSILKEAHHYRYPLSEKRIPDKWYYDYGIGDVRVYFEKLLQGGFLTLGDVRSSIEHSTLPVIKRTLTEYGLSTKGKKAELVEVLLNNIPHDKLDQLFPQKYLQLTEKGKSELEDNPYILTKGGCGLSIWTLNRITHAFPNDDIDYILSMFSNNPRRFLKYLSEDERKALGIKYTEH